MNKWFKILGMIILSGFALSGLSASVYATESIDTNEKAYPSETLFTSENTDSEYTPARPKKETSTKDESDGGNSEIELSREELVNVQYPAFYTKSAGNGRRGYGAVNVYSYNPNTHPLVKLDQKYVDQYIKKLEQCHEYDETSGYCFNDDTSRYILGVDTSTFEASKFDLLRFAQDIEKTSGKKTIVYTQNHYSTSGDKITTNQILMFSDHIKLAEELAKYKAKVGVEPETIKGIFIAVGVLAGLALLILMIVGIAKWKI